MSHGEYEVYTFTKEAFEKSAKMLEPKAGSLFDRPAPVIGGAAAGASKRGASMFDDDDDMFAEADASAAKKAKVEAPAGAGGGGAAGAAGAGAAGARFLDANSPCAALRTSRAANHPPDASRRPRRCSLSQPQRPRLRRVPRWILRAGPFLS